MKHGETPKPRGFAAMSPEKRSAIARLGGIAGHKMGRSHVWTSGPDGTAAIAGRKGGSISRRRPKVPFPNDNSRH